MLDFEEDLKQIQDKKVVLLQSGGLDSCYLACLLSKEGFEIHHLFIDYGQNQKKGELISCNKIVNKYGGTLHTATITLPWYRESTKLCGEVVDDCSNESDVPDNEMGTVFFKTYVPMRNHILLSIAASLAESLGISYIASALDGDQDYYGNPISSSPDKHQNFVMALETSLSEGSSMYHSKGKIFQIIVPLMGNSRETTIKNGLEIGCDFSISNSCYNYTEDGKPCGKCVACLDRINTFKKIGMDDPSF